MIQDRGAKSVVVVQNNKIPPGRSSHEEPRKDPIKTTNNQKDVRGVTAGAT
jgi:hypothetical protein